MKEAWSDTEKRQKYIEAFKKARKKYNYDGFREEFLSLVRETMFEMLGDRCVECNKDMRVNRPMPHHIDPELYRFGILGRRTVAYSWKEIVEEIEKCELRCIRCHRKIHTQLRRRSE